MPDPIAFTIFGIEIRWYALLITAGMFIALIISGRRAWRHQIEKDSLLDLFIVIIPSGVIGARLYYVVFSWDSYKDNLLEIFNIRHGGLAIHGGLIFGIAAGIIYCRIKKVGVLNLMDLVLPQVALAQSIGRWGNYFNGEAHGGPTDVPWAITVDGVKVHPTFLYESVWCLVLFFLLIYVDNRRAFEGQTACLYGILYSIERFFVEGLRTDSLMIGPFRQAQMLSLAVILFCLVSYVYLKKKGGSDGKAV